VIRISKSSAMASAPKPQHPSLILTPVLGRRHRHRFVKSDSRSSASTRLNHRISPCARTRYVNQSGDRTTGGSITSQSTFHHHRTSLRMTATYRHPPTHRLPPRGHHRAKNGNHRRATGMHHRPRGCRIKAYWSITLEVDKITRSLQICAPNHTTGRTTFVKRFTFRICYECAQNKHPQYTQSSCAFPHTKGSDRCGCVSSPSGVGTLCVPAEIRHDYSLPSLNSKTLLFLVTSTLPS